MTDYTELVAQLAELEPIHGFNSPDYLPPLTSTEIADCIEHNEDILDEFLGGDGAKIIARFYREKEGDLLAAAMNLVRSIDKTVMPNARRQVYRDVCAEADARSTL